MRSLTLGLAIAAALLAGVPGAYAFTIVNGGTTNADGSARFADPDQKADNLANQQAGSSGGGSTLHIGRSTLQFNGPSNSNSSVNDRFVDPGTWRTVPSAGR